MLNEAWINKIFSRMEGRYGSLFLDRWRGCDVDNVKATWCEELGGFSDQPESIAFALKLLALEPFPPTLPEFIAACRRAPAKELQKLEYKQTPQETELIKELARKASEIVKPKEFDGLLWAKRPRSQKALDFVIDGKKNPRRYPALAKVFDWLVANQIATESGKLLHRWDGFEWVQPDTKKP